MYVVGGERQSEQDMMTEQPCYWFGTCEELCVLKCNEIKSMSLSNSVKDSTPCLPCSYNKVSNWRGELNHPDLSSPCPISSGTYPSPEGLGEKVTRHDKIGWSGRGNSTHLTPLHILWSKLDICLVNMVATTKLDKCLMNMVATTTSLCS